MKNLVDFIVDAAKDENLSGELAYYVENSDKKTIYTWLVDKGYDVDEDDCAKMFDNKDNFSQSSLGLMY